MLINVGPDGFLLTDTGRLMGSSKPVLFGISNLVEKLGMPLEEVCRLSSLNVAHKYGFTDRGSISAGKYADLLIIDDEYQPIHTYSEGRIVYDRTVDKELFNQAYLAEVRVK
ncbi:hypothetical protein SDC9_119792 [bioreactor metagenome]|uniref:Amidohydrolase-related domain-containing protein n=1 Tax=bioreactor metagenome TaxID=1076179 RepID=A0A645C4V3_9ZZZZ